ncbi:MAG: hypothetical protein KAR25_00835 [Methanosarcinales archaeon]|nr:hypothetical protein [Methanosarcinales archaeon]
MSLESDSTKNVACIQKTPNGRLLGVAIFMDAEIIEVEETQHKNQWHKKPLIRLCVALFLWVLRELLDWS